MGEKKSGVLKVGEGKRPASEFSETGMGDDDRRAAGLGGLGTCGACANVVGGMEKPRVLF